MTQHTTNQWTVSAPALLALFGLLLAVCAGCGPSSDPESATEKAPQAASGAADHDAGPRPLVLYNWEEYLGTDTLRQFTQATGIEVDLRTYEDDEDVMGALQSGSLDADLIIVSESVAAEMREARLLAPLDMQAMPNMTHLMPHTLRAQDGKHYQVPYLMGFTGIAVNTRLVPDFVQSWRLLWDQRLKGRIAMLNNPFEVIAAASMMLGKTLNPTPDEIDAVRDVLLEQQPLLAGYLHDTAIMGALASEELWAAQSYNCDALVVMEDNPDVHFFLPREGCAAWMDVFVLPQLSSNQEGALSLINFIHAPKIMAEIASELWAATPNRAAMEFIDPRVLDAPEVYPPEEVLARCSQFGDMGSPQSVRARLQLWSELMTGH